MKLHVWKHVPLEFVNIIAMILKMFYFMHLVLGLCWKIYSFA